MVKTIDFSAETEKLLRIRPSFLIKYGTLLIFLILFVVVLIGSHFRNSTNVIVSKFSLTKVGTNENLDAWDKVDILKSSNLDKIVEPLKNTQVYSIKFLVNEHVLNLMRTANKIYFNLELPNEHRQIEMTKFFFQKDEQAVNQININFIFTNKNVVQDLNNPPKMKNSISFLKLIDKSFGVQILQQVFHKK